ncbi:MAG TPA: NAD(P)H-dependent oxidoreductase [Bacteroidales bacterium]|jgi:glutathione-regulated potassium-efflux system ancillary protein KefG|nr:NAD(P)H-dependent oxidoreductase [Bacteroidales bacterium]
MKKWLFLNLITLLFLAPVTLVSQEARSFNAQTMTEAEINTLYANNSIVIFVAHPNLKESTANAALLKEVRNVSAVKIVDLYDNPKKGFNIEEHTQIVREASAIVLQFPFYFASAPSQMKKWIDEVFYTFTQTDIIKGKPLLIVTTTGSEESSYRSGGRNLFTMDELLRPYQLMCIYSGMEWKTPFVVYGMSTNEAEANLAEGCKEYKNVLFSLLQSEKPKMLKNTKKSMPKISAPGKTEIAPPQRKSNK